MRLWVGLPCAGIKDSNALECTCLGARYSSRIIEVLLDAGAEVNDADVKSESPLVNHFRVFFSRNKDEFDEWKAFTPYDKGLIF
jgi:hypothetical protein